MTVSPTTKRQLWAIAGFAAAVAILSGVLRSDYYQLVLTQVLLWAVLSLAWNILCGYSGYFSFGHAAFWGLGAYTVVLGMVIFDLTPWITIPFCLVVGGIAGALIGFPTFRLRGHYVTIATLGVGEIVMLVILNWDSLTHGPVGLTAIPPLSLFGGPLLSGTWVYQIALGALIVLALLQWRLLSSHLGRTLRAIRDDDVAARSYGIALDRYKGLAFGVAGFSAGIAGALMAHIFSYVNHETFTSQVSLLALTMVILGGLGNVAGAILGAVALVSLPELFRAAADYRMLIYGIALLLLIRYRPQGLMGTV